SGTWSASRSSATSTATPWPTWRRRRRASCPGPPWLPQTTDHTGHVGRDGRLELDALVRSRIGEGQASGVQHQPRDVEAGPDAPVALVADDGMADGGKVDADLVGATRLEPEAPQRAGDRLGELPLDLVLGAGRAARRRHRHTRRIPRRPADRRVHHAPARLWHAPPPPPVP